MKIKSNSLIVFLRFALLPSMILPLMTWAFPVSGYDMPLENNSAIDPSRYVAVNYELKPVKATVTIPAKNYEAISVTFDSLKVLPNYDDKGQTLTGYDQFSFSPDLVKPFSRLNTTALVTIDKADIFGTVVVENREFTITLSGSGRNIPNLIYPRVRFQETVPESAPLVTPLNPVAKNLGVYLHSENSNMANSPSVRLVWPLNPEKYYRVCATGVSGDGVIHKAENLYDVYFDSVDEFGAFLFRPTWAKDLYDLRTITYRVYEFNRVGEGAPVLRSKTVSANDTALKFSPGASKLGVVAEADGADGTKNFSLTMQGGFNGASAKLFAFVTTDGLKLSKDYSVFSKLEIDVKVTSPAGSGRPVFSISTDQQNRIGLTRPVFFRLESYNSDSSAPSKVWDSENAVYFNPALNFNAEVHPLGVVLKADGADSTKNFSLTIPNAFTGDRVSIVAFQTTNGGKLSTSNSIIASLTLNADYESLKTKAQCEFSLTTEQRSKFNPDWPVFFRLLSYKTGFSVPDKVWDLSNPVYFNSAKDFRSGIKGFACELNSSSNNCDLTVTALVPTTRSKVYRLNVYRSTQPGLFKQSILQLAGYAKLNDYEEILSTDVGVTETEERKQPNGSVITVETGRSIFTKTITDNQVVAGVTYYYRAVLTAYDDNMAWDPILRTFNGNCIFRKDGQSTLPSTVNVALGLGANGTELGREIKNKQAFVGFAFDRDLVVTDRATDRNRWFGEDAYAYTQFKDLLRLLDNKTHIRVGGKFVDHFQKNINTYTDKRLSLFSVQGFLRTIEENGGGSFGLPSVRLVVEKGRDDEFKNRINVESTALKSSNPSVINSGLLQWELGNEPDWLVQESKYSEVLSYAIDYQHYRTEMDLVKKAVGYNSEAKRDHLFVGPSTSHHTETSLLAWTLQAPRDWLLSETTLHYYWRSSNHFALLSPENLLQADSSLHNALQTLEQTGVDFRLNEVATCFNGGARGLSDSHASALWAVNVMLLSASHGAAGINFQSGYSENGSCYSPFYSVERDVAVGTITEKKRVVSQINPTFLGMFAMSKALAPSRRTPVSSKVDDSPKFDESVYIKKMNLVTDSPSTDSIDSFSQPNPLASGRKVNFDAYQISHTDSKVIVLVNNEADVSVDFNLGSLGTNYHLLKLAPAIGCSLSSKTTGQRSATTINGIQISSGDLQKFVYDMAQGGGFVTDKTKLTRVGGVDRVHTSDKPIITVPPGSAYFLKFQTNRAVLTPIPLELTEFTQANSNGSLVVNEVKFGFSDYSPEFSIYINPPVTSPISLSDNLRSKITKYSLFNNSGVLFKGFNKGDSLSFFSTLSLFGLKDRWGPLTGTGSAFIPQVGSDLKFPMAAAFTLKPGFVHSLNISLLPPTLYQGARTPILFRGKGTVNFNVRNGLGGGIIVTDGATLKLADPKLDFFRTEGSAGVRPNKDIRNPEYLLGNGDIVLGVTGGQDSQGGVLDLNKWPSFNKRIVVKGRGNLIKNGGLSNSAVIVLEANAQLTLNNVSGSGSLSGGGGSEIIYQGNVQLLNVSAFNGTTFTPFNKDDSLNKGVSLSIKGALTLNQKNMFYKMKTVADINKLPSPSYDSAKVVAAPPVAAPPVAASQTITYAGTLLVPDGSADFPLPRGGTLTATYNKRTRQLDISFALGAGVVTFPGSTVPNSWTDTVPSGPYQITYKLDPQKLFLFGVLKKDGNGFASFYVDPTS